VITTLRAWLDSWPGIGRIAVGMALKATTYSSRAMEMRAGAQRSTRPGARTRPWQARRGSKRRGAPFRARRGRA